jgi:hypothetical protein
MKDCIHYDCGCHLQHPTSENSKMEWCWFHEPERSRRREAERLKRHFAFEDANGNPLRFLWNMLVH